MSQKNNEYLKYASSVDIIDIDMEEWLENKANTKERQYWRKKMKEDKDGVR